MASHRKAGNPVLLAHLAQRARALLETLGRQVRLLEPQAPRQPVEEQAERPVAQRQVARLEKPAKRANVSRIVGYPPPNPAMPQWFVMLEMHTRANAERWEMGA